MATEKPSWCLCSDSTERVTSIFHELPTQGCDGRGQRIQHSSGGEQRGLVTLRKAEGPGGLSPHKNPLVCMWNSHGEDGNLHSQLLLWRISQNPAVTPLKILLGKALLTKGFSWQGCTQKPELKCSDSVWTMEMEDYQWPESFVQGARICLIPGVTQSLMTELCLRPGWSTTGQIRGAGRKSRKEPESLLLIPSENAVSQPKATRRETSTVQHKGLIWI